MKKKLFFSILSVIAISVIAFGVTYAYYESFSTENVTGEAKEGITSTLSLEVIHDGSSKLVPLYDRYVKDAITKESNPCVDNSRFQYNVCSLYKITLTNEGSSENLYGFVRTKDTTYETNNLKYQIYDSTYNAITDVITLSKVVDETVYFTKDNNNSTISSTGNEIYYLVVWLSDTGELQSEDYSKTFSGSVGFESVTDFGTGLSQIEASFE